MCWCKWLCQSRLKALSTQLNCNIEHLCTTNRETIQPGAWKRIIITCYGKVKRLQGNGWLHEKDKFEESHQITSFQKIIEKILYGTVVYCYGLFLVQMDLSCHPSTVACKLKELGKDHDHELLKWKQSLERDDEMKRRKEILKAEINTLTYLPILLSTAEFKAYAKSYSQ